MKDNEILRALNIALQFLESTGSRIALTDRVLRIGWRHAIDTMDYYKSFGP